MRQATRPSFAEKASARTLRDLVALVIELEQRIAGLEALSVLDAFPA